MRTTTLIALIGTTTAAATLEADCKAKDSKTCTADLCWTDMKLADTKTYLSCADFDTDADKCEFAGEGCTAALCADHEVQDKSTDKTAKGYNWSQQCTYAQVQTMKLDTGATTTDKFDTMNKSAKTADTTAASTASTDKTDSTKAASTYTTCTTKTYKPKKTAAELKTECAADLKAKTAAETKETTSAAASAKDKSIFDATTTWMADVDNQNTLKAGDLKACLLEDTDATCKTLQTTNKTALTKAKTATSAAKKAYKACEDKTYKPVKTAAELKTECAADLKTQTDAETKEAQVQMWVTNVDAALTNSWTGDAAAPQHELWMESSIKDAKLESDATKIQTQIDGWYTAAQADVKSTEATVTSTAATQKTDAAKVKSTAATETTDADKVTSTTAADKKKSDAATKKAMDDATTAHKASTKASADAVTAHDKSVKASADAVTAHTKAVTKETELKAWVAWVKAALKNDWDNTTQPWQKTWFDNKCDATKKTSKADMQTIQDATTKDLTAATADKKTLAAAVVTDTTALDDANKKVTAETDKTTTEEKKTNGDAVTAATTKLDDAKTAVTANDAKITGLTARQTYGKAVLDDADNIKEWAKEETADKAAAKKKADDAAAAKKKADDAAAAAKKKADDAAAAKKKAAAKTNDKKTSKKEDLEKAVTDAKAAATKSSDAVTKTTKEIGEKCKTADEKKTDACTKLAATLKTEEATSKTDKAAVKTAEDALKAHGGSSVGIIIGCVAGALVLVGGVAYWKHKQNAKNSENQAQGDKPEFSADDCYTAFVDEEL